MAKDNVIGESRNTDNTLSDFCKIRGGSEGCRLR